MGEVIVDDVVYLIISNNQYTNVRNTQATFNTQPDFAEVYEIERWKNET